MERKRLLCGRGSMSEDEIKNFRNIEDKNPEIHNQSEPDQEVLNSTEFNFGYEKLNLN